MIQRQEQAARQQAACLDEYLRDFNAPVEEHALFAGSYGFFVYTSISLPREQPWGQVRHAFLKLLCLCPRLFA
jgi:hypothetical protein